jgi:hypothetical protein
MAFNESERDVDPQPKRDSPTPSRDYRLVLIVTLVLGAAVMIWWIIRVLG